MNTYNPFMLKRDRRRRKYIDVAIQKWYVVVFIMLEVALIGFTVAVLYADLSATIDDNIYRVHHSAHRNVMATLLPRVGYAMAGLVVINLLALLAAEGIWVRSVNNLLHAFTRLLVKVENLDFRKDGTITRHHDALDGMLTWRQSERERCCAIRSTIEQIQPDVDFSDPQARTLAKAHLEQLRKLASSPGS